MNIQKRTAVISAVGVGKTTVNIIIESYIKMMFTNPAYITPRLVVSSPNHELAVGAVPGVPTNIVLTDPTDTGGSVRYVVMSRNTVPYNDMEYTIYYDTKYKDIIIMPSFELYDGLSYLDGTDITVSAYAANFGGDSKSVVPVPNPNLVINCDIVVLGQPISNAHGEKYSEKMITGTFNYSAPSIYPTTLINFGTPAALFPTLGFVADVNVYGYDSLFEGGPQYLGKQIIDTSGIIVAVLPV